MDGSHADIADAADSADAAAPASGLDRRLNDKVLAAFTHAYAAGEVELAARLRQILDETVSDPRAPTPDRRSDSPMERANRWVEFVDARNRYRAACSSDAPPDDDDRSAIEAMKASYQRWCAT